MPGLRARLSAVAVSAAVFFVAAGNVAPASASLAQPSIASEVPSTKTPHAVNDAIVANAEVRTFTQVGQTMYAGGDFHTVQNPSRTINYTRDNLFAFDVTTGQPTPWAPSINGEVSTTTVVGSYLYVGGLFTAADGVSGHLVRYNLSTATPTIDPNWHAPTTSANVTDMELVNGRLIVSGLFSKRLVALDPSTGQNTGYLDLGISGTVASNAGGSRVYRFAVDPSKTKLVAIGNFTTVSGAERYRAFMVNLGTTSGTLASWYYQPLRNICAASSLPVYMRDVDFSPDGSYFVFAATGFVPTSTAAIGTDLCDSASRFETNNPAPVKPTWINYTGGDTLLSIAAVGSAVYVGGHQRWLDNPFGRDSDGGNASPRPGVGAIDPITGKALAWNPTKDRGVGLSVIYPTATGVWFGSDGRLFHGAVHDSIAFTPLS